MAEFRAAERITEYGAPQPEASLRTMLPAYVLRIRIRRTERGETVLSFVTARNQSIPLKRFTVSYICEQRGNGVFLQTEGSVECEGGEINGTQAVICHALLGEKWNNTEIPPESLFAWVSEAEEENGSVHFYGREGFRYPESGAASKILYVSGEDPFVSETTGEKPLSPPASDPAAGETGLCAASDPAVKDPENGETRTRKKRTGRENRKEKKKNNPLISALVAISVILAACIGVPLVIGAVFLGYHSVKFQYLKPAVGELIAAGRQDLAEDFVGRYLSDNLFYHQYAEELKNAVDKLRSEKNWSRAYAVSRKGPCASLTEEVCRDATEDALLRQDWEEAYLYASACPNPFGETVAKQAADHVWDAETGTWNENAYLTAQKSADPTVAEALNGYLAERYYMAGDKAMTRAAANRMTDREAAEGWYKRLRQDELSAVLAERSDEDILLYLEAHMEEDDIPPLIAAYRDRIFQAAWSERRVADIFRMAGDWGFDTASLAVSAEDPDVRADLADYFRLTPEQMRAYHAERVSAGSRPAVVRKDGTVTWMEHGVEKTETNVLSVSAGLFRVCMLKQDGTVSAYALSSSGNEETPISAEDAAFIAEVRSLTGVVAMASGEKHAVFLHEDGTVTVIGDNSCGQSDTRSWREIVAVAAGPFFTVGLRSDGTAVGCGSNGAGQLRLSGYRNITDVRACSETVILLFRDGTAEAVGERSMGLSDVSGFRDVRRIRAGCGTVVAELADGTCILAGGGAEGSHGSVSGWKNETEFDVGEGYVVRIGADGSAEANGTGAPKHP